MTKHQLKRVHPWKPGKRVGRGGKRGTTSGRGTKGQKARAGHRIRPALRDVIKKLPKRRGFKFLPISIRPAAITLTAVDRRLTDGAVVSPKTLAAAGLVAGRRGRLPAVKIIGGRLSKKFTFQNLQISAGAAAAIKQSGGKIETATAKA